SKGLLKLLTASEASRTFDLAHGPLLRTSLLRLGPDEHVVLFSLHHIISDGWSMGVLVREISELYKTFSEGEPTRLTELSIQYSDFARWQRQWLQGEVLDEQVSYWKGQLAGAPEVLDLPLDHPRPAVQSLRGAHEAISLSEETTEGLQELGR